MNIQKEILEKEAKNFIIAINMIAQSQRAADVIKNPELILGFKNERDLAYFEAFLKTNLPHDYMFSGKDFELYGIKVKLRMEGSKEFEIYRKF